MATNLTRITQRRKTEEQWSNATEVLLDGELAIVKDNNNPKLKIGNAIAQAKDLPNLEFVTSEQKDKLDKSFMTTTVAAISGFTGPLKSNYFITTDIEGQWYYDAADTTSADNYGTVRVTADGKRIKRYINTPINVKWFGAKGDGIINDTIAIQKAIDFIPEGFNLFIPKGKYLITKIQIGKKNINIIGEKGTEIFSNTTSEMIELLNCENLTFDNIKFSSYFTNNNLSYVTWGVFYTLNKVIKNLKITNCSFTNPNTYTNAIKLVFETDTSYIDGFILENTTIENVGRMGIEFQNHSSTTQERFFNINIHDNIFKNLGTLVGLDGWYGMAISVSGMGRNVNVCRNLLDKNIGIGIEVVGGSNYVTILNNKFRNFQDSVQGPITLISLDGKVRDIQAIVSGNQSMDDVPGGRVYIRRVVDGVISNNYFNLTGEFYLRDLQTCSIITNSLKSSYNRLVYMETSTTGGIFKNTNFIDNVFESTSTSGSAVILVGPNISNVNFSGGSIKKLSGEFLIDSTGNSITMKDVKLDYDINFQTPYQINITDSNTILREQQVQYRVLQIAGNLTAARTITLPVSRRRTIEITNATNFPLSFITVGGVVGITIQPGFTDKLTVRNISLDVSSSEQKNRNYTGIGSPEAILSAIPGSLYRRTDLGELYVKNTGIANLGWGKVLTEATSKYGTRILSGSGQTTINIPHGFTVIPKYTNVNAKSDDARNAGIVSWTEDATNIIITTNIAAATGVNNLIYSWEAKV